jgi:catechol 2,3-dioxygenase-like lactoylglutathione lyase family enzyme
MEDVMGASVHISLNVSDLDRSVDFYRGFFGEPRKVKPDYAKFVVATPEIHLALQPGRRPGDGQGALSHLGIRVDSEAAVERWKQDLQARGLTPEKEEREACCYALQEKFWVADPDGNRWEVYTVLEDVEAPRRESGACCSAVPEGFAVRS